MYSIQFNSGDCATGAILNEGKALYWEKCRSNSYRPNSLCLKKTSKRTRHHSSSTHSLAASTASNHLVRMKPLCARVCGRPRTHRRCCKSAGVDSNQS